MNEGSRVIGPIGASLGVAVTVAIAPSVETGVILYKGVGLAGFGDSVTVGGILTVIGGIPLAAGVIAYSPGGDVPDKDDFRYFRGDESDVRL